MVRRSLLIKFFLHLDNTRDLISVRAFAVLLETLVPQSEPNSASNPVEPAAHRDFPRLTSPSLAAWWVW